MADSNKKKFYRNQAQSIIGKLKLRKMEGFYADTMDKAVEKVLELLGPESKTVCYGGSMTLDNSDIKKRIKEKGHELIVREDAKTDEEMRQLKSRMINSDVFLMSTNAITLDGELINIDGRGNRVSYLIYGPDRVFVIAGMNKVVKDVNEGIDRTRNVASPANTVRLGCDTPCAKTGRCADCLDHTICCQIVVTRCSMVPQRITVILVGEELGY